MNSSEFKAWWQDFGDRFPSKRTWLENNGGQSTLSHWATILGRTPLQFAMDANAEIHCGNEDFPERDWDRIPSCIAAIANRLKVNAEVASRQSDEPVIEGRECGLCHNTGLVECWSPNTIRPIAKRWSEGLIKRATVAVACKCHHGDRFATWTRFDGKKTVTTPYFRYDEAQWCLVRIGEDYRDTIETWLDNRLPRYDFGEFGQ